jgi:biofilm PGA synthesis protein PgaA
MAAGAPGDYRAPGVLTTGRPPAWTAVLAAVLVACLAGPAPAQDADREAAVRLARRGELDPAIDSLRALRQRYPQDVPVAADLAVILHWAGRNAEALEVFETIGLDAAPDYALLVGARAARATGKLDVADTYLQRGAVRFPADPAWRTTRVLVLVDLQRLDEARRLAEEVYEEDPGSLEALLAKAYFHQQAAEWPEAFRLYSDVLRRAPEHRDARRGRVMALQALGAPFQAEELAREAPGILDPGERARVAGTRAAMLLRANQLPSDDPRRGFAVSDRAIAELERQLTELQGRPGFEVPLLRARFDLLVAYRDRERMGDAVAAYEALRQDGVVPPAYVRNSAAAAYLYLERPEPAHDAYRSVLAESPKDPDALLGLFYALVELERFDDAYALVDALDRDEPLSRGYAGTTATYDNPRKLDTALVAALARYYGDQLGEAWDRISALSEAAPANSWVQASAAAVARGRGWPRRSLALVAPWLTLADEDVGLEQERAASLLAARRYQEAEPLIDRLRLRYPEDKSIEALGRDWDTYRLWELTVHVGPNKGDEPTADGFGLEVRSRLVSPPIAYNWRVAAGYRYATSDTPEGRVELHRGAAGLEYRGPLFQGSGAVTYNATSTDIDEVGGRLQGRWTPNDHWSVYAAGEIFADSTPLRALKNGATADAVEAGAGYRFHESRAVEVAWRFTDFSDGNERHELFARLGQRVVDLPRLDVVATLDLYYSTNTEQNVFYYSPERVFTPSVVVSAEHVTWRRYRRSFVQALQLTLGGTFQGGFDAAVIGDVQYEHRWRWDPRFELSYGLRAGSHVFDGDREQSYAGFVQVTVRF